MGNIINLAALICAFVYRWPEMQAINRKQNRHTVAFKPADSKFRLTSSILMRGFVPSWRT